MFKNKAVIILYDNDKAGRAGATEALNQITKVTYGEITDPKTRMPKGKDLTNWIQAQPQKVVGYLTDRVHGARQYLNKPKPNICPHCGQVMKEVK
jgi:DNA primase